MGDSEEVTKFERKWAELVAREREVHTAKRLRYTGGGDPLANYRQTSEGLCMLIDALISDTAAKLLRERGAMPAMIARLTEKLQRITVMLGQHDFLYPQQGEDETFEDTCIDIAVIAKLCAIEAWRLKR